MKPKVVGFVFARGGSKGVPRKNIRPLAGKPLIGHAIETGLASQYIERMVVSTDDEEIAAVARRYGADVPFMRPPELATDKAPEWKAWQHAIRAVQDESSGDFDIFVCLPATAPLRAVEDVDACIETLLADSTVDLVITVSPAHHNPYFNMIVLDENRSARLVMEAAGVTNGPIARRQDAPVVYDQTTVCYAARPEFVLNSTRQFDGRVRAVVVPPDRALDIDTELDFQFAEFLLQQEQHRVPWPHARGHAA